jgi:hypothetical protein
MMEAVDDAWTLTLVTARKCCLRKAQLAMAQGNEGVVGLRFFVALGTRKGSGGSSA